MKSTPKWLLIPPAVAVLLVLGPLSMQGRDDARATGAPPAATAENEAATPDAAPTGTKRGRTGNLVPRTPDFWQMGSALVGVLLLGVGGLIALRRLRGGALPAGNSTLATLRQTVRLSARQALHAVEFDDRILLIGEHERGLVLLDRGRLPDSAADEAEVLGRGEAPIADEDEGAVPKNLVIPRPTRPAQRPTAPRPQPQTPAAPKLGDFRSLLQKVGR